MHPIVLNSVSGAKTGAHEKMICQLMLDDQAGMSPCSKGSPVGG
jgi:hypothetical protein